MWELIANQRLFTGDTETDVLLSVFSKEAPPLASFNPSATETLERIVQKALMKNPNERYQLVSEMFRKR